MKHRYLLSNTQKAIGCILSVLYLLSVLSCSPVPEDTPIFLSGSVDKQDYNWPAFVAISKNVEIQSIEALPQDAFVDLVEVTSSDNTFGIELSDKGLLPGDAVMVVAFIDKDYTSGIPYPEEGDLVGLYYDEVTLTPAYYLRSGYNNSIEIELNRMVQSIDAGISGTITCEDTGTVTLIAYAGEIVSSDFREFDPDYVIAYQQMTKESTTMAFNMEIWPYLPVGLTLPIKNVYVFALLDINQNDEIDEGDRIGYYIADNGEWPSGIEVATGANTLQSAIELPMDITNSEGYMRLSGNITLPTAYSASADPGPLYAIIANADEWDSDPDDPYAAIKYFKRIEQGETDIDFDLSSSSLSPGDEVYIFSLWDRDYESGIPEITDNDFVGAYVNRETLSPRYTLKIGLNEGVELSCNRIYDSNPDTSISGTVTGSKTGNVTIVAYAGRITSSDISQLDQDGVIGFQTITKDSTDASFSIDLSYRPYLYTYPIENVYIAAWLDVEKNGNAPNGEIDEGDMTGYLKDDENLPVTMDVLRGQDNIIASPIELTTELENTASYNVSIKGSIVLPSVYTYTDAWPIYLVVAQADTFDANDPISSILYFQKLEVAQSEFELDLSKTGLGPGDRVMLYAFWDLDYKGTIPLPTEGDMIGLCQNKILYQYTIVLEEGVNYVDPGAFWEFRINKKIYDHNAFIKFSINEGDLPNRFNDNPDEDDNNLDEGDQILVMAVYKDGVYEYWLNQFHEEVEEGLEINTISGLPDLDYVIGMTTITYSEDTDYYTLNILPMIYEEIPVSTTGDGGFIDDVYLFAILDHDQDGAEYFEMLGYYRQRYNELFWVPDSFDVLNDAGDADGTSLTEPVPVYFTNHNASEMFQKICIFIYNIFESLLTLGQN